MGEEVPHPGEGRPEDRQQLTTFDAARAAAARRGMDGIGFAPMPEWGITALDFDNCVVDGGLHPEVERIVAGTYAEFSPSGTGVRAIPLGTEEALALLGELKGAALLDGLTRIERETGWRLCAYGRIEVAPVDPAARG